MDWKLELVAVPVTDVAPHCRLVGGQVVGDLLELGQRGTQVFDDLGCQDAWMRRGAAPPRTACAWVRPPFAPCVPPCVAVQVEDRAP